MQAIVKIGKSQFMVSPGQELLIDKTSQTEGTLTLDQVLMVIDGPDIQIGTPFVSGVAVLAKILGQEKGDKIRSAVYTAKSRHRRVTGFRPQFTRVKIEDIKSASAKNEKPVKAEKTEKKPSVSTAKPKTSIRKTVKSST